AGSGGSSDGKLKERSTRSCGPEWRWIFIRIAMVGTLNRVAPILTGNRAGLLEASAPQVGHSKWATRPIAPDVTAHPSTIGITWPRERSREPRAMCWAVENNVINETS